MKVIRKKIYKHRMNQDTYLTFLRERGADIGKDVRIFYPEETFIDDTRAWMLSIGNNVQITSGVRILTHGYEWSVLKGKYGYVLGSCGKVTIGDNCFIGMNTTILKGVTIGRDCIIGANSLVNRDIPDGTIAAGNPAKVVMSIDEYLEKRLQKQIYEAQELYNYYFKRFRREPKEDIFDEFFWLFKERDSDLTEGQIKKMKLLGNYEESVQLFRNTQPRFRGYEEFLYYLRNQM